MAMAGWGLLEVTAAGYRQWQWHRGAKDMSVGSAAACLGLCLSAATTGGAYGVAIGTASSLRTNPYTNRT